MLPIVLTVPRRRSVSGRLHTLHVRLALKYILPLVDVKAVALLVDMSD